MKLFNPQNAFDAEGLTRSPRKSRHGGRSATTLNRIPISPCARRISKSEKLALEISRDSEYSRLEQEREVAIRRAQQRAEIALERTCANARSRKPRSR